MSDFDNLKASKTTNPQGLKLTDIQTNSQQYQSNELPGFKDSKNIISPNSKNQTAVSLRGNTMTSLEKMKSVDSKSTNDHSKEELLKENEKLHLLVAQLRTENQRLHRMLDEEREMHHQVIHERNAFIAQLTAEIDQLKKIYKQDHQWVLNQEAELNEKEKEIEKKQESLTEKEIQLAEKERGLRQKMRKRNVASSEYDSDSQISEFTDPKIDCNFRDLQQGLDGLLTPQSIPHEDKTGAPPSITTEKNQTQFPDDRIISRKQGFDSQRRLDSDFAEDDSESSSQRPSGRRARQNLSNHTQNLEQQQQADDINVLTLESSLQSDRKNKINNEDNVISDTDNSKQGRDEFELID